MDAVGDARAGRLRPLPRGVRRVRPRRHGQLSLFGAERPVGSDIACPACGAREWIERTARLSFKTTIHCRTCGYEVPAAFTRSSPRDEDEGPLGPDPVEPLEIPFVVYAPVGSGEPEFAGATSVPDGVTEFALRRGGVTVWSGPGVEADPRRALSDALLSARPRLPDDADPAARSIDLHVALLGIDASVASAVSAPLQIAADGLPQPFDVVRADGAWGAGGRIGDVSVRISATHGAPEQVALTVHAPVGPRSLRMVLGREWPPTP